MPTQRVRDFLVVICLLANTVQAGLLTDLTHKVTATMSDSPRYTKLPLFEPHRKSFTCVYQDPHLPPIDPQAELWFQQALALDSPDIYYKQRDYPQIYTLYKQAAERNHWKAMLNLASLILLQRPSVPEQGNEAAIVWVEKAMQLGVPDAWDRMGIYHQNGIVKGGNATSAYAFFQRAAEMGSPAAMTYLGEKLAANYDNPGDGFWGNMPIGTKMLECAFAQGFGDAAYELGFIYADSSTESKLRALKTFHEGVKLGSAKCAHNLDSEFRGFGLNQGFNLVGRIDKARAERYAAIGDALEWYQGRLKLPNLDKVLPLPPADLPKWDGNKQTLIDAAKAVVPPLPAKPAPTAASQRQGRAHIPDGYTVASQSESTFSVAGDQRVPQSGYYLSSISSSSNAIPEAVASHDSRVVPQRYEAGEYFAAPDFQWLSPRNVLWHYLGEARPLPPPPSVYLQQMVRAGLIREIPAIAPLPPCDGLALCPQTGIWEGRIASDHAQAFLFNQWHQQAFVEQGQTFPDPQTRLLDIAPEDVRWRYKGSPNMDGGIPGGQGVAL